MVSDLLIRAATVIDGAGAARFAAEVAVKDGLITPAVRSGDAFLNHYAGLTL